MSIGIKERLSHLFALQINRESQGVRNENPEDTNFLALSKTLGVEQMIALCDQSYSGYLALAFQSEEGVVSSNYVIQTPETFLVSLEVVLGIRCKESILELNEIARRKGLKQVFDTRTFETLENLGKSLNRLEAEGIKQQLISAKLTYLDHCLNGYCRS